MFLVRDWIHEEKYPHGFEGGNAYMKHRVFQTAKPDKSGSTSLMLKDIASAFDKVRCFLLPEPSENVRKGNEINPEGKQAVIWIWNNANTCLQVNLCPIILMPSLLTKIPNIIIQIYFLNDLLYIRVSNFHKACDSVWNIIWPQNRAKMLIYFQNSVNLFWQKLAICSTPNEFFCRFMFLLWNWIWTNMLVDKKN